MARLVAGPEIGEEVVDLFGVVADVSSAIRIGQGRGGSRVTARGTAQTEIDASGMQRFENSEILRDVESTVMGQHDPSAPHPNPTGAGGDLSDQDLGRRASEAREVVVLSHPEALVAQAVGQLAQGDGFPKGSGRGLASTDR